VDKTILIEKRTHDAFEALHWVALATSKGDARFWVSALVVRGGVAEGTDGHRLHRVFAPNPADAVWTALEGSAWRVESRTPRKLTLVEDSDAFKVWPDVSTRFRPPDEPRAKGALPTRASDELFDSAGLRYLTFHAEYAKVTGEFFLAWKYFQDATQEADGWALCRDDDGPVVFTNGAGREAYVMPCKTGKWRFRTTEESGCANTRP